MKKITIWHNPRCSKSRQALALLEEAAAELEVLKYLDSPPTRKELRAALDKLQMKPQELVRRGEAVFKTLELTDNSSNEDWLTAMIEHPILIERPVIISQSQAVIGRPPENALMLLN